MLPLQDRLEMWAAQTEDFIDGGDKDLIYGRCVKASLERPETARLLGKRAGVDGESVYLQMQLPRQRCYAMSRCPSSRLDAAVDKLQEIHDKHTTADRRTDWNWRALCFLITLPALVILLFGGMTALLIALPIATIVMAVLCARDSPTGTNLRYALAAVGLEISWLVQRVEVGVCAMHWGQELQANGTGPVVDELVRHMLGEDPDSLFIPEGYELGMRAPRSPGFVVENAARRQLERKLSHIEDGTIAVCGPRGAGKTTLLEQTVEKAGFGVIVQAPATYTPYDFLLSLSVKLCVKYMLHKGYQPPEPTQLSPVRRLLRKLKIQIKRLGLWSTFAVPAAVLLVLGLSAPVRTLYAQYAESVTDFARTHAASIRDDAAGVWQGHTIIASVTVTVAGIAWWRARHAAWLPRTLGRLWTRGSRPLGRLVIWLSIASVLLDKQLHQQARYLYQTEQQASATTAVSVTALLFAWWVMRQMRDSKVEFGLGPWNVSLEKIFRPIAAGCGIYLCLYLINNPQTHALLSDPENPLRIAGIIIGVLLMKAANWRPEPEEPELVSQCRKHLYRLQTIQQSTNGLTTGGAAQILTLGANHTTSISTIPPNYPELVEEFRDLLRAIAAQEAGQLRTVVIAIDEVDRLGTSAQALAFLSEIKAILGVPDVYYLISVAEDVGAAFVRRGLPHRDVTDSSLDDIIHVQPSTLKESLAVLAKRSHTLKGPHVMLAHALSGGVVRDLLRYGLQIREIQEKTQSHELTDISRSLVLEELAETFAGFRTLLSQQQWTPHTSEILAQFRTMCGYLRDPCRCTEVEALHALEQFAARTTPPANEAADPQELTDEIRQLVDEASAYAYFSVTLLDIFSTAGLERRMQLAAQHGPDGDPERLAEARQELGISPYSARPLIESIRKAWSLPLAVTTSSFTSSPVVNCVRHNRIV
ncbi:hypothetical protein [Streptomyces sp. PA5.6]|uniref:hypothetical protein n=1 Tax=Streptomyces sp. PA5.6 TaxID=3035651 RepID=UPI003904B4C6